MTWPTSAFTRAFAPLQSPAGRSATELGSSSVPLPGIRANWIAAAQNARCPLLTPAGQALVIRRLAIVLGVLVLALAATATGLLGLGAERAVAVLAFGAVACATAIVALSLDGGRGKAEQQGSAQGRTVPVVAAPSASANVAPLPGRAAIDGWSQLLQRVSHELRTPLNAVIGFSDVMQREMLGPLGDARYVEYAAHIRSSGSDLLKATEDTLALTTLMGRADGQRREVYPLASLMHEVVRGVHARPALRDAVVEIVIDRDCEVEIERRAVVQAVLNVTSALLRHAPAGAGITIGARPVGENVLLTVTPSQPARGAAREALDMCLARTLLQLTGLAMHETRSGDDCAALMIVLPAAAQSELFG